MLVNHRVLVVDPNRIVRDWVKAALLPDVDVMELDKASSLSSLVNSDPADLILIDAELPGLETEIATAQGSLETSGRHTRFVLFSTLPPEALERKVTETGAFSYLRKSGDAETFKCRVAEFLARDSSASQQLGQLPFTPKIDSISTPAEIPDPPRRPITASSRPTAIVAGSDPWSRVVVNWLSSRFSVVSTANAADLRGEIEQSNPNLVVLGQDMPDGSVEDICLSIRAHKRLKRTSMLFIGNRGEAERAKKVQAAGANVALLRPLKELTFFATVNELGHVAVRRDSRLLIRIEVRLTEAPGFHIGFTSNLSASGMLIESDYQAEVDAEISTRFFLPGRAEEISARAKVIRVQGRTQGMVLFGARFLTLGIKERAAIESFVDGSF